MRYNPFDHNVAVFGDSGSGKSNFVRYFLRQLPPSVPFWVWDYNRQHSYPRIVRTLDALHYERTIIQPDDLSEGNFARFCMKAARIGNIVVVIEEIQEYETPHKLTAGNFFRAARNVGTTYLAISQRPAELNKAIVSNAHHRFVFRLTIPSDVTQLTKWISPTMEQVHDLPNYFYLYHNKLDGKPPQKCQPVPLTESI